MSDPWHRPAGAQRALAGIALVTASTACFAMLDTMTKFISAGVPLLMALWFRYAFQAVATTAVMWPQRGWTLFRTHNYKLQMVRGLLLLLCSWLGFASLQRMPVAEFSAIFFLMGWSPAVIEATER